MYVILNRIKKILKEIVPLSTVILFGSHARKEANEESDIDLMVILKQDTVSRKEEKDILSHLYGIEFETGKIISPIIITENDWQKASLKTTFYHEVMKERIVL